MQATSAVLYDKEGVHCVTGFIMHSVQCLGLSEKLHFANM